jgi:hypothetical protein
MNTTMEWIKNHKILTVVIALVVLGGIGAAFGGNEETTTSTSSSRNSSEGSQSTSEALKKWEVVKEFSDTKEEGISDSFTLNGGKVRITYDVKAKTDTGTALIYLLKDGTTKTKNEAGELDVALQDVSTIGSKSSSEVVDKPAGNYYIDVNTSSIESYTVKVEEQK